MPQAKPKPIIVEHRFRPEIVDVKLGGLVVVVDTGDTYNVLVSQATFTRRDTALACAALVEKRLAGQVVENSE